MHTKATIGVDFRQRLFYVSDKIPLRLRAQFWDIAGQERFGHLNPVYFRGTCAAIVSCDVTSPATHGAMGKWMLSLREHAPDAVAIMIANKVDLTYDAKAFALWADQFVYDHGLLGWFPVSAKTGFNVKNVVEFLVGHLTEKYHIELFGVIEKKARTVALLLVSMKKFRPACRECPFTWLSRDIVLLIAKRIWALRFCEMRDCFRCIPTKSGFFQF